MKLFIYLLFIYLCIISLGGVSSATIPPKIIDVQNNLLISSLDTVVTDIQVTIDPTISTPKVIVTVTSGQSVLKSIDDILYFKDNKEIHLGDVRKIFDLPAPIDELSSSNKLSFNLISLVGILLFSIFSIRQIKFNQFTIVLVLILTVSLINALDVTGVKVKVEVKIPNGYKFETFTVNVKNTNLNLNSISASNLIINNCLDTINDDTILINSIRVSNSLKICTNNDIKINSLDVKEGNTVNLKSNSGNVDVKIAQIYKGKINFTSKTSSNITGPCISDTTQANNVYTTIGTCYSSDLSEFVISSVNGDIDFYVPDSCPTDANWRGTPDDFGPATPSPSIVTQIPQSDIYVFNKVSDWSSIAYTKAGLSSDSTSTLIVSLPSWYGNEFWIGAKQVTTPFNKDYNYKVSFDFKLGSALTKFNNITKVSFVFLKDKWGLFNVSRTYSPGDDEIFQTFDFPGSVSFSDTTLTSKTLNFKPTDNVPSNLAMAIHVETSGDNEATTPKYYFNNIKISLPARPATSPTLITKDSQLVTLRKPSSSLDPQTYNDCPHSATDLKHWHDPATWTNNQVPSAFETITLPNNTKVLITSCSLSSDIYQKIIIPATSQLIFSDSPITLNVKDIYVQGKLLMGATSCRLNSNININFYGPKVSTDTIGTFMGSKGIASTSTGFISIHGKQYHPTWSRLAASAWPGDILVYLQDSVNWEVGQEILLTTSTWKDDINDHHNEVIKIAAVSGKVIQLATPLKRLHFANMDYQVEVGLLSRRIKIQSKDALADQFGGHIMMMGEGQVSGVQLTNMGQQNIRARYPLHFHLAKVLNNSYITDNSIVSSFYRCVTIHGSHNAQVLRNVAYDTYGHCFYLEDGVEENSTIAYNLAAFVHYIYLPAQGTGQGGQVFGETALLKQPADTAAAGFYITNAYNRIIGNAASGGWSSYSFPNLPIPIGNHANLTNINPSSKPTLEFDGNTAHSSGYYFWFGSCVYVGGKLTTGSDGLLSYQSGRNDRNTKDYSGQNVDFMRFTNTKVMVSKSSGIGHWGNTVEITKYESHDNDISATVFGQAWMDQVIVNANSGNIEAIEISPRQGFQFYDTWTQTILTNIKWKNFAQIVPKPDNAQEDNSVIVSMTHSDKYKPQGISATKNFTYENVALTQYIGHRIQDTGASRYFNFMDFDGSSTNTKGTPKLVGSHSNWWVFNNSACQYNNDWLVYFCDKQGKEVVNIDVEVPGIIEPDEDHEADPIYVGRLTQFGTDGTGRTLPVTNNVGITGVSNIGWYLYMNNTSPTQWRIHTRLIPYGTYILLAIRYPANTVFTITSNYQWNSNYNATFTKVTSLNSVKTGDGKSYYFDNNHLYIKVVNHLLTGASGEYFERGGVRIYTISTGYYYNIKASCASCAVTESVPA